MAIKILVCGDNFVGKTSLREKFFSMGNIYDSPVMTIMGCVFNMKKIKWVRGSLAGQNVVGQFWEMSNEEEFSSRRPFFYKGTNVAILVYDVTNSQSFDNLDNWLQEIIVSEGIIPFVVIANKIDLKREIQNSVPRNLGNEFARRISEEFLNNTYNVPFIESSAKTGEVIGSKPIIPSNVDPENFYSIF